MPGPTTSRAGRPDRLIVFARWGSYHGNTLGALDLSGRKPLRRPYEGWLGRFRHVSAAYPYRADDPGANALGTADELAAELDRAFEAAGPGTVAAFVAEPIVGATLAAAVPPDGYWPAIAEVCRRHGVLLIADEVMTGFGRTGRWFALDHFGRPRGHPRRGQGRIVGLLAVRVRGGLGRGLPGGDRRRCRLRPRLHLLACPVGAAVAREVLRILETEDLVEASAAKGDRLLGLLEARSGGHPAVGEIRGRGLLVGIELVADRETRAPFPRGDRIAEAVVRAPVTRGVLLYSGTGNANGVDGDTILLGPPFIVTDAELDRIVAVLADTIEAVAASPTRRPAKPSRARGLRRARAAVRADQQERPERQQDDRQEQPGERRAGDVGRRRRAPGGRRTTAASPSRRR